LKVTGKKIDLLTRISSKLDLPDPSEFEKTVETDNGYDSENEQYDGK